MKNFVIDFTLRKFDGTERKGSLNRTAESKGEVEMKAMPDVLDMLLAESEQGTNREGHYLLEYSAIEIKVLEKIEEKEVEEWPY